VLDGTLRISNVSASPPIHSDHASGDAATPPKEALSIAGLASSQYTQTDLLQDLVGCVAITDASMDECLQRRHTSDEHLPYPLVVR
jgi:hypothetical protein